MPVAYCCNQCKHGKKQKFAKCVSGANICAWRSNNHKLPAVILENTVENNKNIFTSCLSYDILGREKGSAKLSKFKEEKL